MWILAQVWINLPSLIRRLNLNRNLLNERFQLLAQLISSYKSLGSVRRDFSLGSYHLLVLLDLCGTIETLSSSSRILISFVWPCESSRVVWRWRNLANNFIEPRLMNRGPPCRIWCQARCNSWPVSSSRMSYWCARTSRSDFMGVQGKYGIWAGNADRSHQWLVNTIIPLMERTGSSKSSLASHRRRRLIPNNIKAKDYQIYFEWRLYLLVKSVVHWFYW